MGKRRSLLWVVWIMLPAILLIVAGWRVYSPLAVKRQEPVEQRIVVAKATPPVQPSPEEAGLQQFTVCIDPGHPSEVSSGAVVQNGLKEVEINWEVGQRLTQLLEENGIKIVLTKKRGNELVTNRSRAEIANSAQACLMLRLHCDTGNGSGITTYYPDRQGTKGGKTGPSTEIIQDSREAAEILHKSAAAVLGNALKDNGIKGDSQTYVGGIQGALTGSIFSEVPAVTVEMVYLSSAADAKFIGSDAGQDKMARALAAAVMDYLKSGRK